MAFAATAREYPDRNVPPFVGPASQTADRIDAARLRALHAEVVAQSVSDRWPAPVRAAIIVGGGIASWIGLIAIFVAAIR
ncbi:hypothetical protein Q4F19_18315 [Sphingomonas sp. BIUV-7]|uniref:Uncharacterized protein n=1 Tax=Sphingomonas natans TaxID=3063330 RepID=A0ABT8YD96_9SPHN|nr:hypothetical protein [Sphingomonas sp. BIUV-7]MDO6416346.1 hypothetical protein [Sphingomonas sp. BIUV-7]